MHVRSLNPYQQVDAALATAQPCDVGSRDLVCPPVRVLGNGFQVDVLVQLHVLGVDAHHLQSPCLIWHADVYLAVEATESAQYKLQRVRGGCGGCRESSIDVAATAAIRARDSIL